MVELDQFKYTLNGYEQPLKEVRDSLDLENKEQRVEELEREMEAPDFWDNAERSQKMMLLLFRIFRKCWMSSREILNISELKHCFPENMTRIMPL